MLNKSTLFLVLSTALFSWSCNDSVRDLDTDITATEDHLLAQTAFIDVFRQVHRMAIEDSLLIEQGFQSDLQDACLDTIYFTSSSQAVQKSLWLDWGSSDDRPNCEDDKLRYGLINVQIDGFYPENFNQMTIDLVNYRVDSLELFGQFVIDYLGKTNGQRQYNIVFKDGELHTQDGIALWTCDWYILQTEGSDLPKPFDDVFEFRGKSKGRGVNGNAFEVQNDGAMYFDMRCSYPYGAEQTLKLDNLLDRQISINDGCDNLCSVTNLNGRWDIEIPY